MYQKKLKDFLQALLEIQIAKRNAAKFDEKAQFT